jgi:uncharacterized membrane protein HdeD (DUF308 family)
MLVLLKDVPVINHPVFRIVLGLAIIAAGVTVLHRDIIALAIGAFILLSGLVQGTRALTSRPQKGQPR